MLLHLWVKLQHLFHSILKVLRVVLSGMKNGYIRVMKIISEFECFMYFMDEIVILKNLWIGLNSRSDIKKYCLFWFLLYWLTCLIEKLYTFPYSGFRYFRS